MFTDYGINLNNTDFVSMESRFENLLSKALVSKY
jgi:hypothetical protein